MMTFILALSITTASEPFDTSTLARHYDRLTQALTSYSMETTISVDPGQSPRRLVQTRTMIDGPQWMQETLHFAKNETEVEA